MQEFNHYSVMLNEAIDALNCDNSDKIFVDATLGGGGHSELILKKISQKGRLISFDVDIDAINASRERLCEYKNLTIIHDSYTNIRENLEKMGIKKITGGIIYDLGASYHQLTSQSRGFSFMKDSPLDMRFGENSKLSAWDVVNKYKESQLVEIFSKYGEEHYSKRIARAIVNSRPINTTLELVDIIRKSTPMTNTKTHCATRVFQAIRIEVNNELLNFEKSLKDVVTLLDTGAIISVITFHSLEDRLAKTLLKNFSLNCRCDKSIPVCRCEGKLVELVNKKPICASEEEIKLNPPSRSAKLRVARRV